MEGRLRGVKIGDEIRRLRIGQGPLFQVRAVRIHGLLVRPLEELRAPRRGAVTPVVDRAMRDRAPPRDRIRPQLRLRASTEQIEACRQKEEEEIEGNRNRSDGKELWCLPGVQAGYLLFDDDIAKTCPKTCGLC